MFSFPVLVTLVLQENRFFHFPKMMWKGKNDRYIACIYVVPSTFCSVDETSVDPACCSFNGQLVYFNIKQSVEWIKFSLLTFQLFQFHSHSSCFWNSLHQLPVLVPIIVYIVKWTHKDNVYHLTSYVSSGTLYFVSSLLSLSYNYSCYNSMTYLVFAFRRYYSNSTSQEVTILTETIANLFDKWSLLRGWQKSHLNLLLSC